MKVLYTSNLEIGYIHKKKTSVVASNVNISVEKGKLVSLIGPNGIGKSTLLRTLTGIQPALNGNVYLNDRDIKSYSSNELSQQQSMVLTDALPPNNLSVFELIALGRQPYTNWLGTLSPADIIQVNLAMELTNTTSLALKKHYEISDGQLQNVLIARAIAQDTPLIVLDEPTTHLDLQHKASLFRLLKKLCSETGKSILFSTHDIEMAIQLSDSLIVMQPGKVAQGTAAAFVENGTFNNLFGDDGIHFDTEKNGFVFRLF